MTVTTLYPDGQGAETNSPHFVGLANRWDNVNTDDTATYNHTFWNDAPDATFVQYRDFYTLTNLGVGVPTAAIITKVKVFVKYKGHTCGAGKSCANIIMHMRGNGGGISDSGGRAVDICNVYETISWECSTNPDGGEWTKATLDTAQVGITYECSRWDGKGHTDNRACFVYVEVTWITGVDISDAFPITDSVETILNPFPTDSFPITDNVETILNPFPIDTFPITDSVETSLETSFMLTGDSHAVHLPLPEYGNETGAIQNDLMLFNFWSENRSLNNIGINSEPFTLKGTVYSNISNKELGMYEIAARFLNIHDMMNKHEKVTIRGLGACFDAVYVIKNFRYATIRNVPHAYTWELTLEYVGVAPEEEEEEEDIFGVCFPLCFPICFDQLL